MNGTKNATQGGTITRVIYVDYILMYDTHTHTKKKKKTTIKRDTITRVKDRN
jgi:hypothetical protein